MSDHNNMTDSSLAPKKSRRRFMADMLFLGGGLTAAALLAKTQLGDSFLPDPSPDVAGAMEMPAPSEQATPHAKGESVPPKSHNAPPEPAIDGDYALPEGQTELEGCRKEPVQPQEPHLGGKPIAPQAPPPSATQQRWQSR